LKQLTEWSSEGWLFEGTLQYDSKKGFWEGIILINCMINLTVDAEQSHRIDGTVLRMLAAQKRNYSLCCED